MLKRRETGGPAGHGNDNASPEAGVVGEADA